MKLTLEKQKPISKKLISKYKTGELRFKTKQQVEALIDYNNGKKGNNYKKMLDFISQLSLEEFISFLEKEKEKQHFNNREIEFYEKLLDRLEELKFLISDKLKYRYYRDTIEEALYKSSKKNNFNYFEEKIKENPKYQKIYNILKTKYIFTTLFAKNKEESYLAITQLDKNTTPIKGNDTLHKLLELLYENKLDSSIHLIKVTNKKLKEIYKNNSDLERYLKGKIVGRGAQEKINKIYENLDYDTAILLAIKNFITQDKEKLEKIKIFLNTQKGNPKNNIDEKLIRAIKLEIKNLTQENNNKEEIKRIIDILENNTDKKLIQNAISKVKYLIETKKGQKYLEYFMFLLTGGSKKTKLANKNFRKITQLKKILANLKSVHKSKTRDFLITEVEKKLVELENYKKNKT